MRQHLKRFFILIFAFILSGTQLLIAQPQSENSNTTHQNSSLIELSQNSVAQLNQASPFSHESETKHFPLLILENEKENEDDDEVSSYEKLVKGNLHFIIIYYLAENTLSELSSENFFYCLKDQTSFSVYVTTIVDFQVFRI